MCLLEGTPLRLAYGLDSCSTCRNSKYELTKESIGNGLVIADATDVLLWFVTSRQTGVNEPASVSVLAIARCVEFADLRLDIWSQALGGTMEELALITSVAPISRIATTRLLQFECARQHGEQYELTSTCRSLVL